MLSVFMLKVVMLSDVAPSSSIEVSLSNALSVKNWQTLVLTVTSENTIQSLVFSGNFAEFVFGYNLELLILNTCICILWVIKKSRIWY